MKFCGLDFETANHCSGSICSVGVAMVENGEVLERKEHLIKPHKTLDWMSNFCQEIHKISYEQSVKLQYCGGFMCEKHPVQNRKF